MDDNKKAATEDSSPMDRQPKEMRPVKLSAAGSRRGMYTAAVSALVVAIVIAFNLLIGGMPTGTLEYDISGKDFYTVTEQSTDFLETLGKDVSIVVLAQSEAIDEHLLKFINNYARQSPRLKLQIIDPVLVPTALTDYNAKENNVVVTCADTGKTKTLDLAGFQGYSSGLMLYDPQYYQYYNQLKPVAMDAEGLLTSAVSFVTSDAVNKMYLLNGHGEGTLGANAASLVSKANIETPALNLLTEGSVPADCQLLLCYNPAKDLTDDELSMLETYLRTGGKLLLLLDAPDLKNFNALLAVYGLQMQNGYVGDNDRNYKTYAQQYGVYCIYPMLSTSSDVTSGISENALLRFPRGLLQVTPERRASTVTPFMTTTANGVLAVDQSTSTAGQYILGATVIETFDDKPGVQTRLTVITAVDLLSEDISASLSNMDIFMNAVVKNYSDVQNISIPSKGLDVTPITVPNPLAWIVLFVVLIPIVVIAGGLVYWIKRRNR